MDRPHDDILTAKTLRLRESSGRIKDTDPLVLFLYLLARDHLPVGAIEKVMGEVEIASVLGETIYTNGWLAQWAQDASKRLTNE